MTDVRQTTATLVLGEELDGRFFVRNAAQELVVELYKPLGRKIELGLEPGDYEVRLDREKASMLAKTRVDDGATVVLGAQQFGVVDARDDEDAGRSEGPRARRTRSTDAIASRSAPACGAASRRNSRVWAATRYSGWAIPTTSARRSR
jgi:hypothetical protein